MVCRSCLELLKHIQIVHTMSKKDNKHKNYGLLWSLEDVHGTKIIKLRTNLLWSLRLPRNVYHLTNKSINVSIMVPKNHTNIYDNHIKQVQNMVLVRDHNLKNCCKLWSLRTINLYKCETYVFYAIIKTI